MVSAIVLYIPRHWVSVFFLLLLFSSAVSAEIPAVFRNSSASARKIRIISTLSGSLKSNQSPSTKAQPTVVKKSVTSPGKLECLSREQVGKSIYIARFQLAQMDKLYSPGISRSYFLTRNSLIERLRKLISIQEGFNRQRPTPFVIE